MSICIKNLAAHVRVLGAGVGMLLLSASMAAAQSGGADQTFVQTSAWLVGPATLSSGDGDVAAMPCVMATQYNNGFMVRFSGGGQKIYAMAIDFRQDVFEESREYEVSLRIGDSFEQKVRALALNQGTLLVNLQKQGGVYDALGKEKVLTLSVAGSVFDFTLLGVQDGLARIESCYGGASSSGPDISSMMKAPDRADDEQVGASSLPAASRFIPPAFRDATKTVVPPVPPRKQDAQGGEAPHPTLSDLKAVQQQREEPEGAPASDGSGLLESQKAAADALDAKIAQLDRMIAGAAQKLATIETAAGSGLQTAAAPVTSREGRQVVPAGGGAVVSGVPERDVAAVPAPAASTRQAYQSSYYGSSQTQYQNQNQPQSPYQPQPPSQPQIQAQVSPETYAPSPQIVPAPSPVPAQAIGTPLANTWMAPAVVQPQRAGLKPYDILVSNTGRGAAAPGASAVVTERHWRAMRGNDLREVLAIWARYEDARLSWQVNGEYAVRESVSVKGTLDEALDEVLGQFTGETTRLAGRVYVDPATGQKVLLVESGSVF